jgi:hypothetical protein
VNAHVGGTDPARAIPGTITTVHQYELPLPSEEVWRLISEVSQYRTWWPWLRAFDAAALASAVLVRAKVGGDVVGEATLTFSDTDAGCTATLDSSLAPGNRALGLVSRFAGPIARFGHDWVLDSGAHQFITRAVEPLVGD